MISPLQKYRYEYKPKTPEIFNFAINKIKPVLGKTCVPASNQEELSRLFPKTYGLREVTFEPGENNWGQRRMNIGVILSGGQAPGGHNVICGLFDALKKANQENLLLGFKGGPSGLTDDRFTLLTGSDIDRYRNTGGFDIIGSGRTKIETDQQFEQALSVCRKHNISGIVIIGGDDSNTNAAVLAEYFASHNAPITVVGCPKTIDGDLKGHGIETSFGFDTATKVYSELIGNIERDAASSRKYWHFIRLMGRSASHITLECALQTQPNICLIGEEVQKKALSLPDIIKNIAQAVVRRAERGDNFGVVLVPEGLIEFIPEIKSLIQELNNIIAKGSEEFSKLESFEEKSRFVQKQLSPGAKKTFLVFPDRIQAQLLTDRDPHGNVQVSKIETERLLVELVKKELKKMKDKGQYMGKFSAQTHFFGYEGRSSFPSNFDSDYCYSLGCNAFFLVAGGFSGYISIIKNLCRPATEWEAGGVPIIGMMCMETRSGQKKPVIQKALVDLQGRPFKHFADQRDEWALKTSYVFPGAIQYAGPPEVCDRTTMTLALEYPNQT